MNRQILLMNMDLIYLLTELTRLNLRQTHRCLCMYLTLQGMNYWFHFHFAVELSTSVPIYSFRSLKNLSKVHKLCSTDEDPNVYTRIHKYFKQSVEGDFLTFFQGSAESLLFNVLKLLKGW